MSPRSSTHPQHADNLFDRLPVAIEALRIAYIPALANVDVSVQPGTLIYITGPHGTGKATLVKILTDVFIPEKGRALFSPHNRALHVSNIAEVLPYLSLYQNLTFGAAEHHPARVRQVIDRLGYGGDADREEHWMIQELDRQIAENDPGWHNQKLQSAKLVDWNKDIEKALPRDDNWVTRLSHNEKKMINLARALLYNPEVLVIQKPVDDCDPTDVADILSVLREYVDNRGVCVDTSPGEVRRRRPRTVFFSGGTSDHSKSSVDVADVVWQLDNNSGDVSISFGGAGRGGEMKAQLAAGRGSQVFGSTSSEKAQERFQVTSMGSRVISSREIPSARGAGGKEAEDVGRGQDVGTDFDPAKVAAQISPRDVSNLKRGAGQDVEAVDLNRADPASQMPPKDISTARGGRGQDAGAEFDQVKVGAQIASRDFSSLRGGGQDAADAGGFGPHRDEAHSALDRYLDEHPESMTAAERVQRFGVGGESHVRPGTPLNSRARWQIWHHFEPKSQDTNLQSRSAGERHASDNTGWCSRTCGV